MYLISGNQPCARNETLCFKSKCINAPFSSPFYVCGQCPQGKVGYRCNIGMYFIIIFELLKRKFEINKKIH